MQKKWKRGVAAILMVALATALLPAPCLAGDIGGGSDGAAITVGILVAVVGVLVIVGMVSDIDYFTQKDAPRKLAELDRIDLRPSLEQSSLYRETVPARVAEPAQEPTLECTAMGLAIRF